MLKKLKVRTRRDSPLGFSDAINSRHRFYILVSFVIFLSETLGCQKSVAKSSELILKGANTLEQLPIQLPNPSENGKLKEYLQLKGKDKKDKRLTIIPEIQNNLNNFIRTRGNPIATVVLIEVATGKILAMAQGQEPEKWGGITHTALHPDFPAASLFKTIIAAGAFEVSSIDALEPISLFGGCNEVHPTGYWMRRDTPQPLNSMTLTRAYGLSCNGFFAKIAVNQVGLGTILSMSRRFGWHGLPLPADFYIPTSPIHVPNPATSSVHTVGRFAAGFGHVGISAVHAGWQTLAIALDGKSKPLQIFTNNESEDKLDFLASPIENQIISHETSQRLRHLMKATVINGTAAFAFRHGKAKKLREITGGKTGTLTGHSPQGLTTWFVGITPLDKPEVVVASVVMLQNLWIFKAPHLAAEAMTAYYDYMNSLKVAAATKEVSTH